MSGLLMMRRLWRAVQWFSRQLTLTGWTVVVACVAVMLLLGTCGYQANRDARASRDRAASEAKALDAARRADGRASEQARIDTIIVHQKEKELTNAVQGFEDTTPSPARRALACERLRQQSGARAAASAGC